MRIDMAALSCAVKANMELLISGTRRWEQWAAGYSLIVYFTFHPSFH